MRRYVIVTRDDPRVPKVTTMIFSSLLPFPVARRIDVFLNHTLFRYRIYGRRGSQRPLALIIDVIRGFVSGIPSCCVANFVREVTLHDGIFYEPEQKSQAGFVAGYRLCPRCARIRNYVPEIERATYLVSYRYSESEICPEVH